MKSGNILSQMQNHSLTGMNLTLTGVKKWILFLWRASASQRVGTHPGMFQNNASKHTHTHDGNNQETHESGKTVFLMQNILWDLQIINYEDFYHS